MRLLVADRIGPHPGLAERVMLQHAFGQAQPVGGVVRPGLEGNVLLVGFDEVEEADLAVGQFFGGIQHGAQEFVNIAVQRKRTQLQAGLHQPLSPFAARDVLLDADEMGDRAFLAAYRGDGLFLVVQAAVLASVYQFTAPDFAGQDGVPHLFVKGLVLPARFQETRVLAKGLLGGVAGQPAPG